MANPNMSNGSVRSVYTSYRPGGNNFIEPPKRRRVLRIILTMFGLLLVTALLIIGFLYWYVISTPVKGELSGRTNILILGIDDTAKLSDTIMLVSVNQSEDPPTSAALISIPRDLFVSIPGHESAKINAAYSLGENEGYPGGGVALMKETIEGVFDVPIHYYATLDFTGFEKAVDTVGGVIIDVSRDIVDPFYPVPGEGLETFSIDKGKQQIDGATALKYARSRQTTSDFDRAARQQQVVLSLLNKVLNVDSILDTNKRSSLLTIYKKHVVTDLSIRELVKLGKILNDNKSRTVTKHVFHTAEGGLLESDTNHVGYVLRPTSGNFTEISTYIKKIFEKSTDNLAPQY